MIYDGRLGNQLVEAVDAVDDLKDFTLKEEADANFTFYDDLSGRELPKDLTMKAIQAEMKQVYAHRIYDKVPLQQCYDITGEGPIGTKRLEINKGDEDEYNIRARLVA